MTEKTVNDVLAHYGILGMKWGVRRTDAQLARAAGRPAWSSPPVKRVPKLIKDSKVLSKKVKKSRKVDKLSPDAAEFTALKQKIKKSGISSLTNEELRIINQRMQLQTTYNKAFPKKKNPLVSIFVKGLMTDVGGTLVVNAVDKKNPKAAAKVATAFELGKQMGVVKGGTKKKKRDDD